MPNDPIYQTKDGQKVTKKQLLESGYSEDRINKGISNGILTVIGDTDTLSETYVTKDGQTVSKSDLIDSGYTEDRISAGLQNGILTPSNESVKKKDAQEFPLLYPRQKGQLSADLRPPGTSTETTVQSPSIFSENEIGAETIFDVSTLDRDIDRQFDFSLSKPTKPKDKYSLSNAYYEKRSAAFDAEKKLAKSTIKKDKESLLAYNVKRSAEIDADVSAANNTLRELTSSISEGMSAQEMMEVSRQMDEQKRIIASGQEYKGKLRNAIATEAIRHIVPEVADLSKEFNAQNIGREILKVTDPEMDQQLQDAERDGTVLPQITIANLERLGLDVAKDYLSKQDQSQGIKRRLQLIDEMSASFDQRNIMVTAQRVREKLGVYFYNEGKSGVFGYKNKDIEKAINDPETGLTENEKKVALEYVLPLERKMTLSTDIPGSGFFRSARNAIERSLIGTGGTIASIMGDRTDAMRAYENLNSEIAQGKYRAPGENPSFIAELSMLNKKEKATTLSDDEKKRKDELDKLVDVRGWFQELRDGAGDLTGQVLQLAILTKGVGNVGKVATGIAESGGVLTGGLTTSAIGTVLSNQTTGLFLNSFLQSYDNYRSQALQILPGEENVANRQGYATVMAAVEGFSERIFNDVKVLGAFTGKIAPSVADITSRLLNKQITTQVAKAEFASAFAKYARPFAKEFIKAEIQEPTEEAVVELANGISQSIFGGQPFDINETGANALKTFITTALFSPVISSMAAHGAVRSSQSQNAFFKSALVDMAVNPAPYLQSVENLRLNNSINQDEANEKIQIIKSANNYLKEKPATFIKKGKDGQDIEVVLDYPQAASYLLHRLNEGIQNKTLESDAAKNDPVLKQQAEASIKRSQTIREGIVDGTVGITPILTEVTDDPKTAADLGIFHTSSVHPDDLVGTNFKLATPEEKEEILTTQLGDEKAKAAIAQVKELVDEDLIPETLSANDRRLAEKYPLQFLQFVAEQAQGEMQFAGQTISTRQNTLDHFGEGIVNAAEDFFSKPQTIQNAQEISNENKTLSTQGEQEQTATLDIGPESTRQQKSFNENGPQTEVLTGSEGAADTTAAPSVTFRSADEVAKILQPVTLSKEQKRGDKINGLPPEKAIKALKEKHSNLDKLLNCITANG